ncbi:MAG: hypothetical protein ACE5GB_06810 [Acidimicrobiales bacterium]
MGNESADTAIAHPDPGDEFARAVASIEQRETERRARRQMWLAHHWPEDYDRCTIIAGRHVCRRCLALYPAALVVAGLALAGLAPWPGSLDLWFIWGLSLPASVEFVAEQTALIRYSARRQTIATLLLAPALGRGFAHELEQRWSTEFWGPVLVFCTVWFAASIMGRTRRAEVPGGEGHRHGDR